MIEDNFSNTNRDIIWIRFTIIMTSWSRSYSTFISLLLHLMSTCIEKKYVPVSKILHVTK